jgi:hypothetical protein
MGAVRDRINAIDERIVVARPTMLDAGVARRSYASAKRLGATANGLSCRSFFPTAVAH